MKLVGRSITSMQSLIVAFCIASFIPGITKAADPVTGAESIIVTWKPAVARKDGSELKPEDRASYTLRMTSPAPTAANPNATVTIALATIPGTASAAIYTIPGGKCIKPTDILELVTVDTAGNLSDPVRLDKPIDRCSPLAPPMPPSDVKVTVNN